MTTTEDHFVMGLQYELEGTRGELEAMRDIAQSQANEMKRSKLNAEMENAKVNNDALIPHDVMVRREAERQRAELEVAMAGEMSVPTKEEAEELLAAFGLSIVGSEYGWSFSETCIRLHNGEIVTRSPSSVLSLYYLRTSLYNIRSNAMNAKGKAVACFHGGLHYADGSSSCYKCHPEQMIPTKSLPTI